MRALRETLPKRTWGPCGLLVEQESVVFALEANKVYGVSGCIRQSSASRTREVTLSLCSALVRLHLQYCAQCYIPQCQRDVDMLDRLPRRATKIIGVLV